MLLRWKESIDASINISKLSTTNPLTQILKNTEEIKARLKTTKANPTQSQIAALPTQIQGTERKPSQQTEQKRKELKVTIRDDKEREETKRKDTRRLVTAIKESEPQEATK